MCHFRDLESARWEELEAPEEKEEPTEEMDLPEVETPEMETPEFEETEIADD